MYYTHFMLGFTMLFAPLTGELLVAPSKSSVDSVYHAEHEKWKAALLDDLKENWLPLAGLFWLKDGSNSFGTDPSNVIVLPKGSAPAHGGAFIKQGEEVSVGLDSGVRATIDGKPAEGVKMRSDASGTPNILELMRLRMHVIKRGSRTGIRLKDLENPALHNLNSLDFYSLDMTFRVTATWLPADGSQKIAITNILGDVEQVTIPGRVRFVLQGREMYLTATGGSAEEGLFFVFSDATAGSETYPGGRFLDTGAITKGTVMLDFNRAYNPPCTATPFATCPLPPGENRLAVPIRAGEKYTQNHSAH
jgi:uncharacterized protein (DUF1684 family)